MSNKNHLVISIKSFFKTLYVSTISYSTVRQASIENKPVAITYRLIQIAIISYIIG